MPARGTWVLVLLAAVFLMHGPPSMAAHASPAGSAAVGASSAVAAPHAGADLLGTTAPLDHQPVTTSDGAPREHGVPAHTAAAHVWAACLAVLLAGLALLGALVLVRRLRPILRDLTAAPLWRARSWPGLLRPPDLATLCVLRT